MYVLFIFLFVLVGFAGALMSSLSVRDRLVDVASGKRAFGRVSSVVSLSGELDSVFFRFVAYLSRFLD